MLTKKIGIIMTNETRNNRKELFYSLENTISEYIEYDKRNSTITVDEIIGSLEDLVKEVKSNPIAMKKIINEEREINNQTLIK